MDKIEYIQEFITRCDAIIESRVEKDAEILEREILGVFGSEIDGIRNQLDLYSNYSGNATNYVGDVTLLRQKLLYYQINLQSEKEKMKYNLELAKLQQSNIITHAEATQSQTTNIDIEIDIEQVTKQIDEISNESLNAEDKDRLKEYLYSLEGIKASKNKSLFWEKTKDVLKFLVDKGADAAIAAMPYIIKGLTS